MLDNRLHFVDTNDVWVMMEYSITESWTKVFSFSPSLFGCHVHLVAYLNGVDEVLLQQRDGVKFFRYQQRTSTIYPVKIHGLSTVEATFTFEDTAPFIGTLLSPT